MVTISLQKPIKGIKKDYKDGYELARAMRNLYKTQLIKQESLERYFDIHELDIDEVTDEMLSNIEETKMLSKDLFTNL